MIIQTKNNIGHHCAPTQSASLSAPEVTFNSTMNGPTRQQHHHHHQPPLSGPPHYVDLHVNAGECVSLQLLDGQEQVVAGPATITMISQQPNPPVPIPVQVPPGHMIHQIADENGTLKQIILSVMDANEDGSQLDSAVITLPQGTFRIDSNGELVSTSTGERSTSTEGGLTPLTTIPQQAYFANYDGCPPPPLPSSSYDATTTTPASLADTVEQSTTTMSKQPVNADLSYQESDVASGEQHALSTTTNDKAAITDLETSTINTSQSSISSNNKTSGTGGNNPASTLVTNSNKTPQFNNKQQSPDCKPVSNQNGIKEEVQQQFVTNRGLTSSGQLGTDESGSKKEIALTAEHQQFQADQSMITPQPSDSISSSYPPAAHQQVVGNEMELMNSGIAPIISTVDSQMYGYPPCCCCCYCDPAQEAAGSGGDQALTGAPGQQDVGSLVPQPSGAGAEQVGGSGRAQASCRSLKHTSTGSNSTLAYPMLGGGGGGRMQSNHGPAPLALATTAGGSPAQPVAGQNGIVPVAGGPRLPADSCNPKLHPTAGKGARNSYNNKQHKMVPVSVGQATGTERGQQSGYGGGGYSGQMGHKSYNSIVSGHHHPHHQSNNSTINHQQNYHQPNTDSIDPSAAQTNVTAFKNQPLYASHQGSLGGGGGVGGYSSAAAAAYSNYNHVPSVTLTNVNSFSKAPLQSSLAGAGGHKQQLVQSTAANPNSGYQQQQHGGRTGQSSDINYMQRAGRDQLGGAYSHSGASNNSSAGGYAQANVRQQQMSQQQHNNENINKSRQFTDKSSNQHNTNRYTNVKVISNNHVINSSMAASCNSPLSHQTGSVSPNRTRTKNSSSSQQQHHQQQHNHHHNHHQNQPDLGTRANHNHHHHPHYNQAVNNGEIKDSNLFNNLHSQANYNGRDSSFQQTNQLKSTNKNAIYPNDGGVPANINATSKHIGVNAGGYHKQASGGAWQANNHKFGQQYAKANSNANRAIPNSSLDAREQSQAEQAGEQAATPVSRPPMQTRSRGTAEATESDTVEGSNTSAVSRDQQHLSLPLSTGEQKDILNEESGSRNSRANKQEKCQNPDMSQPGAEPPQDQQRYKRSPSSNTKAPARSAQSPQLEGSSSPSVELASSGNSGGDNLATSGTKGDTKPKSAKETGPSGKSQPQQQQQSKQSMQSDNQKRAGNKENKSTSQRTLGKQQRVESPKLVAGVSETVGEKLGVCGVGASKQKLSQASLVETSSDANRSNESPDESLAVDSMGDSGSCPQQKHNKHNSKHNITSVNQQIPKVGGDTDSVVAKPTKRPHQPADDKLESTPLDDEKPREDISGKNDYLESQPNETNSDGASSSAASRPESPVCLKSPQLARLTMRTSLSENNIQSLEAHSSRSKQKLVGQTSDNLKTVSPVPSRRKNDLAIATKRRGSNPSKSEQKVKLSTIPQLRILNLNCTSVTSSSVQLRWSYISSLADKHGIHHHHHAKSALMDHFVIESSNNKNPDTNLLVSPKIVYQGCALTCRINHLSSEKIYHFRVRRTALLTVPATSSESSGGGEHSVVSEILSVTLPSVQQQNLNSGGQQQAMISGAGKKNSGGKQRGAISSDANSSDHSQSNAHSLASEDNHHLSAQSNAYHHNHNHHRGNTSSHNSNSNHINSKQSSVKLGNLFRQCRGKFVATLGKLVQSSLSSYSDTKFAGLLLVIFTIFAMLLAVFIHLYIVAPVTE